MRRLAIAGMVMVALIVVATARIPAQEDEAGWADETATTTEADDAFSAEEDSDVIEVDPDCLSQMSVEASACPGIEPAADDASSDPAEESVEASAPVPPEDETVSESSSEPDASQPSTSSKPSAWVPRDLRRPFEPGR